MQVNNPGDVNLANALAWLDKTLQFVDGEQTTLDRKLALASVLDLTNPGWRNDEAIVERVRAVGVVEAGKAMLEKHL